MRLRARAPAKVNLCLFVGPVRGDGRHELVTLFQSVSLADDIVLARAAPGAAADEVRCPGVNGRNLAAEALALYRAETGWAAPPVRLEIAKRVPVAGGMGGGSADAAAALRLAAAAAGRPHEAVLARLAERLGADVPSQLRPGLVLATGAGERLTPMAPRAPFGLLVLPDPEPLSTPDVYREADRLGLPRSAAELAELRDAVASALAGGELPPPELLVNDLEPAARALRPRIDAALAAARAAGAAVALVSGSGPTAFGLFPGAGGPARAAAAAGELAARFPGAAAVVPVDADFGAPREEARA